MKTPPIFTKQPPIKATEPVPPPIPPAMLTHPEAARWLSVSTRFLSKEASLERIRVARFGRVLRYDIKDLIAYAESRKTGGLRPIGHPSDTPVPSRPAQSHP